VAGTKLWIVVTFEPGNTGNVDFGLAPTAATITGLQAGTYTYQTYRGSTLVGSGNVTVSGTEFTFPSPFSNDTVPDNVPTTIEII